jgi:NitT/TauT family transport system permease protein
MKRFLAPLFALVIVAAIWELVRHLASLPPIILPSLHTVFSKVWTIRDLYYHLGVTAAEAGTGFLLGNAVAIAIAIGIIRWPQLESGIVPYAIALKTTPVAAFVPILLLWLGAGFGSKAVAAASVCFFPVLINGVRGLRAVDQDYLDLFKTWRAGWWQTLLYLRLPSSLPYVFAAIKLSSSLALVGAVVAEFVAGDSGLGFLIVRFSRSLDTPEMFATIFVCTALGVTWFLLIVLFERLLARRYGFLVKKGELV